MSTAPTCLVLGVQPHYSESLDLCDAGAGATGGYPASYLKSNQRPREPPAPPEP
jgi:hypothetical protein